MSSRVAFSLRIGIWSCTLAAGCLLSAQLVTAPSQVRRAEPPAATASPVDLERQGDDLRVQKMFADALDYYEAALKRGAKDPGQIHNKMGIAHLQMLRYDVARKEFERSLHFQKDYPEAWNNLGVAWYTKRKYKSAIKAYEKAIELSSSSASFHSNLGTAYFARKEYEKANGEYLRAMELDPDVFEHRDNGPGVALHMSSAEDRAKFSYIIARMYASRGNAERSLLYLKKAMEDGYAQIDSVYKDVEFAALRKDPRFTELMTTRKPTAIPN